MQSPQAAFRSISDALNGVAISYVWLGYGSALFIECGHLTSSSVRRSDGTGRNPKGQWSIGLHCDWRIEQDGGVLCGSQGDRASWIEPLDALIGETVEKVETFGDAAELRVTFKSGRRLLTFALDFDGPDWTLTDNAADPPVWVYWSEGGLRTDDGRKPR